MGSWSQLYLKTRAQVLELPRGDMPWLLHLKTYLWPVLSWMENHSNLRGMSMDSHSFEWDRHSVTEKPYPAVTDPWITPIQDLCISVQEEWDWWAVGGKLPFVQAPQRLSMKSRSILSYELVHKSLSLLEMICVFTLSVEVSNYTDYTDLLGSLQPEALIFINLVSHVFASIRNPMEGWV